MTETIVQVNRWRRFGKDRLYVERADGTKIGFWDLLTDAGFPETPADGAALHDAVAGWKATNPGAVPATSSSPAPVFRVGPYARPDEVLPPANRGDRKVLRAVSRAVGVDVNERSGRYPDEAEDKVAAQLDRLHRKDPRWQVAHVTEIGATDLGFDHLVVGPGGVYVLGSRLVTGRDVWIKGDTCLIDGTRFPYVTDLKATVAHVAGVLSNAAGFTVGVVGLLIVVDAHDRNDSELPAEITVTNRMALTDWFPKRRQVLPDAEQVAIFDLARRHETWAQ